MRLSVLDQSPIAEGSTGSQALHNTIDLAQLADSLGYTRYWVAEHHGGPMLAGPSPEALIGPIASATSSIRVGSGGVMLPHYSPFKVAETFSVLAGLYPGRIDLGLGRAAGTDPMTTHALQRDRSHAMPDDFPQQLAELLGYFDGTIPVSNPLARLQKVLPGRPGDARAVAARLLAAERGLGGRAGPPLRVRGLHQPGRRRDRRALPPRVQPRACGWTTRCSPSPSGRSPPTREEEAIRLASSSRMAFAMLRRGRLIEVPHPDKAVAFLEREGDDGLSPRRRAVLGTPDMVRAGIEAVAAEYGAEEVIVVTITWDHEARRRSYELHRCGVRPSTSVAAAPRRGAFLTRHTTPAHSEPRLRAAVPHARHGADPQPAVLVATTFHPIHVAGAATLIPSDADRVTTFALRTFAVARQHADPVARARLAPADRAVDDVPADGVAVAGDQHAVPAPVTRLNANMLRSEESTISPVSAPRTSFAQRRVLGRALDERDRRCAALSGDAVRAYAVLAPPNTSTPVTALSLSELSRTSLPFERGDRDARAVAGRGHALEDVAVGAVRSVDAAAGDRAHRHAGDAVAGRRVEDEAGARTPGRCRP